MTPLQQDSVWRIASYQMYRDEAKKQGRVADMRKWAKVLEEEYKILEMIKRVEAFNASNEGRQAESVKVGLLVRTWS